MPEIFASSRPGRSACAVDVPGLSQTSSSFSSVQSFVSIRPGAWTLASHFFPCAVHSFCSGTSTRGLSIMLVLGSVCLRSRSQVFAPNGAIWVLEG